VVQTVGAWAAKAATLPAALVDATPRAVRTAGEILEGASRVNVAAATGGDMRLSRVRSGGKRGTGGAGAGTIRLSAELRGTGSRTQALVVPRGPIMLVEGNTARHRIPRKLAGYSGRGYRGRARGAIHIPGVGIFASAQHPGTRGKKPIARAFRSAGPEAGRAGVMVFATAARNHL
jgi:hypothetical protein